jgi:hypothetical protein
VFGDFRKVWQTAGAANGLHGRIVHDLRRSGVRHLIHAAVERVVEAFVPRARWSYTVVRARRQ